MITSKSNEQIKYIVSLKNKKYRDLYSKYILEGIKLVDEISSGSNTPELIVYSKELLEQSNGGLTILDKINKLGLQSTEVSKEVFKYISDTVTPQGILAIIKINRNDEQELKSQILKGSSFIILDKIQDAGNMGTILRNCVSFDIQNIICVVGTVDVYSSKTIRSTMGAINKVNIWYLEDTKLKEIIYIMKQNNYEIVGTHIRATKTLSQYEATSKTVYVMGNEANGVSAEIKSMCDLNVKIEMEANQESLNVSIATGILLYDMYIKRNR
jgi:TrmH family RNA methyltransferase